VPPARGRYHCTIHPSMVGTLALVEQTSARSNGREASLKDAGVRDPRTRNP